MDKAEVRLTVYFEEPFWVGVWERISRGKLSACKVTFGAEPNDCELYEFILKNGSRLHFSPTVEAAEMKEIRNPKRAQREARKQVREVGIGTKSQQALKLQQEQLKAERKAAGRERQKADKQRQLKQKQQKKKEKHKGR